ncbi:MAG: hypothetical protein H7070_12420 [Saprospiraceae bacterium]|nr:hypothetical protein [Pyrinomonadaceae bacterium]
MLDENLLSTLDQILRQTRQAQSRVLAKLRDAEDEVERLREEIKVLENSVSNTERGIDELLAMRSGTRAGTSGSSMRIEDGYERRPELRPAAESRTAKKNNKLSNFRESNTVTYINRGHGVPSRGNNIEPISFRFADRTITQACTLLLREAGKPLHVNELYNLLVTGGMEFKGNNPTISVAVSLNRNRRFRKVDPGTFDLVMREASQAAS